jgi:D-amino-acid oxidase
MRTAVVGSGVIGLSTAIRLVDRGAPPAAVTIFSFGGIEATCSSRAGAVFCGFDCDDAALVADSWRAFAHLAAAEPAAGVRMALSRCYSVRGDSLPPWARAIEGAEPLPPLGPYSCGFQVLVPHVDMTVYLPWLAEQARRRGVAFVSRTIRSFDELFAEGFETVFNCAGLGARDLAADPAVRPARGQVVHVHNTLGLAESLAAHEPDGSITYIYPQTRHIVLGGTYERDTRTKSADPAAVAGIIARCRALLRVAGHPRWADLAAEAPIRIASGLRPARILPRAGGGENLESFRLEVERRPDGRRLIHDYGHGRFGVSVSWGCADRSVALL